MSTVFTVLIRGKYFLGGPQIPPLKILETRIIGDNTVDVVDVDVADHVQARTLYMLYFQAETTIIEGSNSESDTEDVRSRKVYTTLLARARHYFGVACCYAPDPHCMLSRTAHDTRYTYMYSRSR